MSKPSVVIQGTPPFALTPTTTRKQDRPGQLPVPLTSFIGRVDEVASACTLLLQPTVRLLTLTGPGGVGKTRLAIKIAEEYAAISGHDVRFIALASIDDPALVAPAIAQALDIGTSDDATVRERLKNFLRERNILLLVDNMEHVLEAAPILVELLSASFSLKILVTSRAILRISGEHDMPVPPLSVPSVSTRPPGSQVDAIAAAASVQLFVTRASSVCPDFMLTPENATTLATICARLDGLPLAIELAAARCRTLSPQIILHRLNHRLPLLTGGPRDQPARLRTMHAAIAWSHDHLDEIERVFFRRLAVFSGSFGLGAAEAICHDPDVDVDVSGSGSVPTVFDSIEALMEHSLLEHVLPQGSPVLDPRFSMLETVREFGLEALGASPDEASVRRRLANWCLALVEQGRDARRGAERGRWAERIEADYPIVRDAMTWALDQGDAVFALRLGVPLVQFWVLRNAYISEGRGWLEQALARADDVPSTLQAEALVAAGALAKDHDLFDHGEMLLVTGLALARSSGATTAEIRALVNLGIVARFRNKHEQAAAYLRDALSLRACHGLGSGRRLRK